MVASDRTEGLTILEGDQCKATKLGPDGLTRGLGSIYVAC